MMENVKRHTVTAALPYANGPVHIGHLAGCYLPSDIYVRYLRLAGEDVLYICGSDEHGVAITIKAAQEGMTPQQLVDKYDGIMRKGFEGFGISFDIYSRTSLPIHHETAADFFKVLHDKDVFIKKTSRQFYDIEYKQFLADRYIYGTCPNCAYEKAYGDQCEKCGTSLDPSDLINPKSILSGQTPELRETEHWYLPLQNYEDWLKEWILNKHNDWKPNVVGQCRAWLNQGLHERSITRDMDWGVKVPLPGAEGKVLYVWMDAPIGYISAAKEWSQKTGRDWEPYWKDENTRLVHFIGKDNIVFHCIIFPVMLKAHGEFILPDNVPANEFLNIEGDKVSTSRNWAVWLHEYLEEFPGKQDVLRYVLCSISPETKDSDFTWKDFQAKNNSELADILGNFVNRLIVLTHKNFEGKVPARGIASSAEIQLETDIKAFPEKIGALIRDFKFREAQQEMMNLARAGNKYLTEMEPWKLIKTDKEQTATVLHFGLQLLANLAIVAEPFLPFTTQKLKEALGLGELTWADAGRSDLLKEGGAVGQLPILFGKVEDSVIEAQVQKLIASRKPSPLESEQPKVETDKITVSPHDHPATPQDHTAVSTPLQAQPAKEIPPVRENITFDDFAKLDLRVGVIKAAERVPKTDKLLKLLVDIGLEERTVVSGIAAYFNPEDIIGQRVTLVANLAPRAMRGITSQGMILMTEDAQGRLVFMQPKEDVPPGSEIR